jgi:putative ABC transport system permease protein
MTLKDIAFLNLRRRKAKSAFLLAGLLIGVTTVVALMSLVSAMTNDINDKLERFGANILVVPKTENLSLTYGGLSLGGVSFEMEEINESDLIKVGSIRNAANVAAMGPVVLGIIEVSDSKVLMAGVDFKASKILKPWWRTNGRQPKVDEVLLGSEAASKLGLGIGENLISNGRVLKVSGINESTGSQDDQLVFAQLATAQTMLGKEGKVSMVEIAALCKDCPIEEMIRQISGAIPGAKVMGIQQVVKSRMETLSHFQKLSFGVSAVVILVGSLVVLVTMMGSVRERTREIGIFRAIGYRRGHIIRIVLLEAGIISALAGILGYLTGTGATKLFIPLFTESAHVQVPFDPVMAGAALVLSILLGLLASIYPALLAANMDPNEALRSL